jgi:YfiH family protein
MKPTLSHEERDGLTLLTDPGASQAGVRIAFTDRRGGISTGPFESLNLSTAVGDEETSVAANRHAVTAAAGFKLDGFVLARQMHGASVLEVDRKASGVVGEGDALITRSPGVVIGVLTADCVPVLLASQNGVAAVHAGWRGLVGGVIEEAVNTLGNIEAAWVGPGIHACCYEVGPEVEDAFHERALPVAGTRRVDPVRAAVVVLRRAGIDRITSSSECTSCEARFFSHRRDGVTGRQGGFIEWT